MVILRSEHSRRINLLENSEDKSFSVPKNIDLELRTRVIEPLHVAVLRFFSEYRWLVDFSASALIVYALTEAWLQAKGDFNLSLIWIVMMAAFALYPCLVVCGKRLVRSA